MVPGQHLRLMEKVPGRDKKEKETVGLNVFWLFFLKENKVKPHPTPKKTVINQHLTEQSAQTLTLRGIFRSLYSSSFPMTSSNCLGTDARLLHFVDKFALTYI